MSKEIEPSLCLEQIDKATFLYVIGKGLLYEACDFIMEW